ncbi:predicted protein, partial [Nematostella vectensis]
PLGMEDGSIPDSSITASSFRGHPPYNGRLNNQAVGHIGAWAAEKAQKGEFLQVDLSQVTWVTHVATQGRPEMTSANKTMWATEYTIEYSLTGDQWQSYQDENGVIKTFPGNSDRNTVVKNEFSPVIQARYVRIVVQAWYTNIVMRAELYGCILTVCSNITHPLGMEDGSIPDSSITASSFRGHPPYNGRLNNQAVGHIGAWAAEKAQKGEFLQVDLSQVTWVTHVATQGRPEMTSANKTMWATEYTIEYSLTGDQWQSYQDENGVIKVRTRTFPGNSDRNTVVKNEFSPVIQARYVRIVVQAWYTNIVMRAELYGCEG